MPGENHNFNKSLTNFITSKLGKCNWPRNRKVIMHTLWTHALSIGIISKPNMNDYWMYYNRLCAYCPISKIIDACMYRLLILKTSCLSLHFIEFCFANTLIGKLWLLIVWYGRFLLHVKYSNINSQSGSPKTPLWYILGFCTFLLELCMI